MQIKKNILLLGGTTEASSCIRALEKKPIINIIFSLAGVTKNPVLPEHIQVRIGGFGGVVKMAQWIKENHIDAVVDATHPFALQITKNAYQASQISNVPYLRLERPAWQRKEEDLWHEVRSIQEAVEQLGRIPLRVFVTIGRKELSPFKECPVPHTYWIRSVDRPDDVYIPQNAELIQAKGPFSEADEIQFLKQHRIECIVSKNSGGETVYAKISAARRLNIPVILFKRPANEVKPIVYTCLEACHWIEELFQ